MRKRRKIEFINKFNNHRKNNNKIKPNGKRN